MHALPRKDYDGAVDLCKKSSSTLGNSLGFIVEHRDADWETVCQTAGDMAARDIRSHLSLYLSADCHFIFVPLVRIVRNDSGNDRGFRACGLVWR